MSRHRKKKRLPSVAPIAVAQPELGREMASTGDGRDVTRPWIGALALPDDSVLNNVGRGDLDIYREVLNDDEVKSAFTQRQDALIEKEWDVKPGGDSPLDIAAADAMRDQVAAIGFDRVTRLMHYGVFYGYAVAELIYGVRDNRLWVEQVKVRDRRRFRYSPQGELRLLTPQDRQQGEPCLAPYFWHFATGADHDDEPYGMGLAHWLYWPTLFKRNGLKFWLIFLDKHGMPTVIGKFHAGATQEQKNTLLALTRQVQTDSGVVMPEGMALELLEASRSGTPDYQTLYKAMNESIRRVVVGQITSSGGASSSIGGNESLQAEVLASIVKADADVICESWNMGPGKWLTELNFPGAALPQVYRIFEEPEDLEKRAQRDKVIHETTGYQPTRASIEATYGGEWEPAPASPKAALSVPAVEFAEPASSDAVATLLSHSVSTLQSPVNDWLAQIEARLGSATHLEEVGDLLNEMLAELPLAAQAAALTHVFDQATALGMAVPDEQ
ncbi:DUF935 family protein [Providencia rettgeri]